MKKAALYARVSSQRQQEEHTIESQLAELKRQIVKHGNVLVKEYIDDGYTGTRLDRPALEQMRQDLKTNTFDIIYFLCPDRIARDVWLQNIVIDDIIRHKKRMIINGEDYENNPENYFKLTVLGAVSQLERAKIVERTTRGRRHRIRMGHVVSQGSKIYGYRYIKKTLTSPAALVIHEPEAKIVRTIFELFANGKYGLFKLSKWLEDREILTSTGKTFWRQCVIRSMLRNETYAGTRYYDKHTRVKESHSGKKLKFGKTVLRDRADWIGVKVPAIITHDLYEKVQIEIRKRSERYMQPSESRMMSGMLRCGECGHSMSPSRRRIGVWLKMGIRRIYHKTAYLCTWRVQSRAHSDKVVSKCHNPEVITTILEGKVFDMITKTMLDPINLKEHMDFFKKNYRADQKRVEWKLMRLDKKEKELEKQKQHVIDSFVSGQITQQEYVDQNVSLDQELLSTRNKREELLATIPSLHKRDVVEMSMQQFCSSAKLRLGKCVDDISKRKFLLDYVEQIICSRNKVVIVGSVPVQIHADSNTNGEISKISFRIEDDFDKKKFHKKDRVNYLVDGRLKEWGSGGRDVKTHKKSIEELQLAEIKASQITQQVSNRPLRTATVRYMAKSYLKHQKEWSDARDNLVASIIKTSKKTQSATKD